MKRKFTKLLAAFVLLVFMTPSMVALGQTRESYSVTYSYSDLGSMLAGDYADASSYWKVPATAGNTATIAIPITQQPTSNITITFHIANFGNGDPTTSTNSTISAVGTETGSNWNGSGVSSYPSDKNYVDGVMTITKPSTPTILGGLTITMGVNTSVKLFRLQSITVEYTYGGGSTPTTYTVNFDAGDGTFVGNADFPNANNNGITGGNHTLPTATPPTGFDFDGWTATGITTPVTGTYNVSADIDFTAHYTQSGGTGGSNNITFDFEDNTAHRTSGSNSYTGTNTYSENGATITLTYADAVTSGSPLNGSANVMGRVAKNTTNSPIIHIGAIDISNKTITSIEYDVKGNAAMSQYFEYSLDNSNWSSLLSMESVPSSQTTKTVNNLSITGTNLYLRWTTTVSSQTGSNRDFQLDDIVITYTDGGVTPDPSITISGTGIDNNAITLAYNDTENHTATVNAANFSSTPSLTVGRYTNAECTEAYNGSDFTAVLDDNTITYKFANANTSQTESRTYYMRVSSTSPAVVSNVITVTQGVVPTPTITITGSYTINVTTAETEGYKGFSYQNLPITQANDFGVQFYDANNNEITDPDWIVASVTTQPGESGYFVYYYVGANTEGPARTAYFKVYALNDQLNLVYSNKVTIKQEKHKIPGAAGNWVETPFSSLTANDIFVIVGTDALGTTYYAMSNDKGTGAAPDAVVVTVDNGQITSAVSENIQWNISGNSTDGFIFYPNDNDGLTWLYCTNSNNGVRVGTGNAKHFKFDDTYTDYLTTTETTAQRYIGIYNSQDWRCYTLNSSSEFPSNIEGQTFSFYKKVVTATPLNMDVDGFGDNDGGYYLIASPYMVNPAQIGMTTGDYDLYEFDQSKEGSEWRNYKVAPFYLVPGKGYLYAHKTDVEPNVVTGAPYAGTGVIDLAYTGGKPFAGWNLIGNPYASNTTLDKPYYRLNNEGSALNTDTEDAAIAAMEGVFVQATEANQHVVFTAQTRGEKQAVAKANLQVIGRKGEVIDNAIVRFDNGATLEKFYFGNAGASIYFAQDNKEFSIVRSEAHGEMPVNFKAAENGTYTIDVEAENLEVNYLHLIDNLTGMDVDLLTTPSYTFEARKSDIASRFRLVFDANTGNDETNDNFAFINNGELIVNGNGTVQVIDILGRQMFSHEVNSAFRIQNSSFAPGVYVLRLVNGNDVKTQKIVIK